MNLISVFDKYPDQQACINHLEQVGWGDKPTCPFCNRERVARKRENKLVGRWNCHACRKSFNVLSGTVMQKTKIPLQKWFLGIALIVNAKKRLSSHQLARRPGSDAPVSLLHAMARAGGDGEQAKDPVEGNPRSRRTLSRRQASVRATTVKTTSPPPKAAARTSP